MITLDTSAVFALMNRSDPDHLITVAELQRDPGPYLIPAGIMAEVAYLVESRLGAAAMDALLGDLESGAFSLDCGEDDPSRIRALAVRYESMSLGYSDSAVIACAERSGGRVLTLDTRDFGVVAREGTITIHPQ